MSARITRKRAQTSDSPDPVVDASDTQDRATQGGGEIKSAAAPVARTRDKDFWSRDGDIVLVARDVEFRVYKGLLADHSPVLRDMFSLPQPHYLAPPSTAVPAEAPCPVVHLSDSPEDLRHMLRVYMPRGGPNAFFHKEPDYSYHTISAAVRLGHKYQMPDLLDDALEYLKAYYPTDYDEWDDLEDYGPPGFEMEHAIDVVNLARLTDDVGLLLMALLACCITLDANTLIRGFEREDGSLEQLTLYDVGLCYAAQTALLQQSMKATIRVCRTGQVAGACKTHSSCTRRFGEAIRELEDPKVTVAYADPCTRARPIDNLLEKKGSSGVRLCGHCRKMVEERDLSERRAAWKKLPEIFGLTLPPAPGGEAGQAE